MKRAIVTAMLACWASGALAAAGDRVSPQAAVDAAYAVISGPSGTVDAARFDEVFTTGVRFTMVLRGADGRTTVRYFTAAEFKSTFTALMAGKPFFEVGRTIHADQRGDVTTILSDYRSSTTPGGKPFETGRNTFELVCGADGWRVDSIFWEVGAATR